MEYEVYLRQEAFEFLRLRRNKERDALLALFWNLSRDPFRRGDFSDRDHAGREIQVLILRRFAIFFSIGPTMPLRKSR